MAFQRIAEFVSSARSTNNGPQTIHDDSPLRDETETPQHKDHNKLERRAEPHPPGNYLDREISVLQETAVELKSPFESSDNRALPAGDMRKTPREQELEGIIARLQEQVDRCQDDLFRMQPIVQTPDTQIINQYEELCHSISSWTDSVLLRFEQQQQNNSYFSFNSTIDNGTRKLLSSIPEAGEYYTSALIHQWLQNKILGPKVYAYGLSGLYTGIDFNALVKAMEQTMAHLKPSRDKGAINTWRSETLRALVNIPEIARARKDWTNQASADLHDYLSSWFLPMQGQRDSLARLSECIILPTVKLADSIQLSSVQYRFEQIDGRNPILNMQDVSVRALKEWKVIDVVSRKTLKSSSPVVADQGGRIGSPIILLEPALWRVSEQELCLRTSTVILRLKQPLVRQSMGQEPSKRESRILRG